MFKSDEANVFTAYIQQYEITDVVQFVFPSNQNSELSQFYKFDRFIATAYHFHYWRFKQKHLSYLHAILMNIFENRIWNMIYSTNVTVAVRKILKYDNNNIHR